MRQIEAGCGRIDAPGDGGEAALGWFGSRGAQVGQGRGIAIEQHGIGHDALAIGQFHPAGAAARDDDAGDIGAAAQCGALPFGEAAQGIGHRPHAALHQPDAILLDMGHQHQRGRCEPG